MHLFGSVNGRASDNVIQDNSLSGNAAGAKLMR